MPYASINALARPVLLLVAGMVGCVTIAYPAFAQDCTSLGVSVAEVEVCSRGDRAEAVVSIGGVRLGKVDASKDYVNETGVRESDNFVVEFAIPSNRHPLWGIPTSLLPGAALKYKIRLLRSDRPGKASHFNTRGDVIYEECKWNMTQRAYCLQWDIANFKSKCWICGGWQSLINSG